MMMQKKTQTPGKGFISPEITVQIKQEVVDANER